MDKNKDIKINSAELNEETTASPEDSKKTSPKAKNKKNGTFRDKFFFALFMMVWVTIVLWNFAVPDQSFSESENRALSEFPTFTWDGLLDGDFMDNMNKYLNDQFAGKEIWITSKSVLDYGLGKREASEVLLGDNALFGDHAPADEAITQANIDGVNLFAEKTGLPSYMIIVPSAAAVQPDKLPTFAALLWDENAFINATYAKISSKTTVVDVASILQQHKDEYIYYRTDHHWTSYGAFLGYSELLLAMGRVPLGQQDFIISTISTDFLGTYHSKTGFPFVAADEIQLYENGTATSYAMATGFDSSVAGTTSTKFESVYFKDFLSRKDKYSFFLGQVTPKSTITTQSTSGKKLLVFKDSYAHSMMPLLLDGYSEIVLIDLRLGVLDKFDFSFDDFDEVLFLYSADTFAHYNLTGKLVDYFERNAA